MGTRMGLSASGEIDKDDFGVSFNAALETGGFILGKTIRLEIEVEGTELASFSRGTHCRIKVAEDELDYAFLVFCIRSAARRFTFTHAAASTSN